MSKWHALAVLFILFAAGWAIRLQEGAGFSGQGRRAAARSAGVDPGNTPGFRFEDATERYGLRHRYLSPALDPRLGDRVDLLFVAPGASVADVNGDGFMDILVVSPNPGEPSKLYISQKGTRFEERGAEWGISALAKTDFAPNAAFFWDYDNDGYPDLFVSGLGCSRLFHNERTRFVEIRDSGLTVCDNSSGALPVDVDGDGKLDLYVLRFWNSTNYFKIESPNNYPENGTDANNGGHNALYRNLGDGRFANVTASSGGGDTAHWSWDATLGDLDGDGKLELYVANDFGPDDVYRIEDGKLRNVSRDLIPPDRQFGMDTSLVDFDGGGKPALYVSNLNEGGFGYGIFNNFFWQHSGDGQLTERGGEVGLGACGWAWGAAAYDFDLDGRQDLYVTSGFISPTEKKVDQYQYYRGTFQTLPGFVFSNIFNWPELKGRMLYGNSADCLFMNHGRHFEDEYATLTADQIWDGRAVAGIDLAGTGAMSLIVTTRNSGVHLLENRVDPGRHWIGFRLRGTRSNRDAVGARVRIEQHGKVQWRWATGGRSGFLASSDPRIHFGLGDGPVSPVRVTVYWPRGGAQELGELEPGRYHEVVEK